MESELESRKFVPTITRRNLLRLAGLTGAAAVLAACGESAAPASTAPSSAPASSAGAVSAAAGAPAASASAKPAASGAASAAASGGTAPSVAVSQADWDKIVAAAKTEGKVSINTYPGATIQTAFQVFSKTYPDIKIEQTTLNAAALSPRILAERKAGIYTWDVLQMPTTTPLQVLNPAGVFDPIKPAIVAPDVVDDKVWRDGFAAGFRLTNDKQLCYAFVITQTPSIYIDTDKVKPEEIKSGTDLLNPKWKGKIVSADPRTAGNAFTPMTFARLKLGDDFLQKLIVDQQLAIVTDGVQAGQQIAHGAYSIAIGADIPVIQDFQKQGVAKSLQPVFLPDVQGVGSGMPVWLANKAPHPNAAKVFINWWLSKEGQDAWAKNTLQNSRRLDIAPGDPSTVVPPGLNLPDANEEQYVPELAKTQALAKQLIK